MAKDWKVDDVKQDEGGPYTVYSDDEGHQHIQSVSQVKRVRQDDAGSGDSSSGSGGSEW